MGRRCRKTWTQAEDRLDETRLLFLGGQALLGFQFQNASGPSRTLAGTGPVCFALESGHSINHPFREYGWD
jgi:hypothetical protein